MVPPPPPILPGARHLPFPTYTHGPPTHPPYYQELIIAMRLGDVDHQLALLAEQEQAQATGATCLGPDELMDLAGSCGKGG